MENRSIKELLQLMLEHQDYFYSGLCGWCTNLSCKGVITFTEYNLLNSYILSNSLNQIDGAFWWERGDIKPRIEWLKEHIKINS